MHVGSSCPACTACYNNQFILSRRRTALIVDELQNTQIRIQFTCTADTATPFLTAVSAADFADKLMCIWLSSLCHAASWSEAV
jgi:hypothetical protein